MREVHTLPESCLKTMSFECSDGGRKAYIEEMNLTELPTGDCAVVPTVHAINVKPTAGSYGRAVLELETRNIVLSQWTGKIRGKTTLGRLKRKLLHRVARSTNRCKEPIHGTLTPIYDSLLSDNGYSHIFELDPLLMP